MRLHTYHLLLTVEALEDDICQLVQSLEEGCGNCRVGFIRPCSYKSFYKLVNSIEAVKQHLLEKLSVKSIDNKHILQLFYKVCVLESDLHSLLCESYRAKTSEHLCPKDFNCKPYKKCDWQECAITCSRPKKKSLTQSSQTFHKRLFLETLSEPSSESSEDIIYVRKYYSSETSPFSQSEPNSLVYDRHYYTQSKPSCKRKTCMGVRQSKTKNLLKKHKRIPNYIIPKRETRKNSDISVHKKSKRKSKKLNTRSKIQLKKLDVRKSQSDKLGIYSKKKPQKDVILVREYPSSETSIVSKYEHNLLSDNIDNVDSKSSTRKIPRMDIRKSKTKYLNKKEHQKHSKKSKDKIKQSNDTVRRQYRTKSKPKKNKYRSKGQSNKFDIRKSNSTNIRVYSKRKPQESYIYLARWNENPKEVFESKMTNNKPGKYYVSHIKKIDTSSDEVYDIDPYDSYNHRNLNYDLKLTSKYKDKRSHYDVNRNKHLSPIQFQLHSNESNSTPPAVFIKPQSTDIKSKPQSRRREANALQYMVYNNLIQEKKGDINDPFEENTNNNNKQMSTVKSEKNETGKLSSELDNIRGDNSNKNGQKLTVINDLSNSIDSFPNHKNKFKSNKSKDSKNDKEIKDPKIPNINKSNESVHSEKKLDSDTKASVSLPPPNADVPGKKNTNNKSQPMSKTNQISITKNEEPLVYSLKYSKEKRRTADVSPMRRSLSLLNDSLTSQCKPVTFVEELHLSEHKFNGKEIHKKLHKHLNHLEENERNRMAAGYSKNVAVNCNSQKDMSIKNHDNFRGYKNILTKSVWTMSECSTSIDWKTIAQVMKEHQ